RSSNRTRSPASAAMPPRLAAVVVLPTPPLVEMMDTTCMGFLPVLSEKETSGAFVEPVFDPLVDFGSVPAHGTHPQANRLGKLTRFHQVVDVRALEAGFGLDFGAAQDAAFDRLSRKRLNSHIEHS